MYSSLCPGPSLNVLLTLRELAEKVNAGFDGIDAADTSLRIQLMDVGAARTC